MSKRILVVEDEPNLRLPLVRRLIRLGYRVAEADNGLQALSLIHREPPDLVLLDVSLPLHSGIEILRRLREEPRFRSLPVVMLTGVCDRDRVQEIVALGVSQYLVKPADPRQLETELSRILRPIEATPGASGIATPATSTFDDSPSPPTSAERGAILVAESNEEAMRRLLATFPGSAFAARDGAEAVHAAWKMRPRVAFVATTLSVLDGIDVIHRLRTLPAPNRCAIIAMALRTDRVAMRRAREAGAHFVLEKPFESAAARRLVDRVLAPAELPSQNVLGATGSDVVILLHPEIPPLPEAMDLAARIRRLAERGIRGAVIDIDPIHPDDSPGLADAQEIAAAIEFARAVGVRIELVARGASADLLRSFRETAALPLHESIVAAEAAFDGHPVDAGADPARASAPPPLSESR